MGVNVWVKESVVYCVIYTVAVPPSISQMQNYRKDLLQAIVLCNFNGFLLMAGQYSQRLSVVNSREEIFNKFLLYFHNKARVRGVIMLTL